MIGMIILAGQLNRFLDNYCCGMGKYLQGEHGLTMIIGIAGGFVAQKYYTEKDVKDFLFSQLILFKLMIVPPIIYEL